MTAQVFQVITTQDQAAPEKRRRQWLHVGDPLVVGGMIVTVLIERDRDPWLALHSNGGEHLGDVPMSPLSFSNAELVVIPRAYRFHPSGLVDAVLLEIQSTGAKTPSWFHQEDNRNANL